MSAALESYRAYCKTKNLSPQTWRWYRTHLSAFVLWLDQDGCAGLEDLSAPHVYRFIEYIQTSDTFNGRGRRSDHSVHAYVQIIKTFLRWAADEELASPRLWQRVNLPKVESKVLRTLNREQYHILTVACTDEYLPWLQHRDRAILSLLLDTGVRAAEVCALRMEDVRLVRGDPHVVVYGKGRKERAVGPLGRESVQLLERYLRRYRPDADQPYVFLSKQHLPLTPRGLDKVLERLRDWAGRERFEGIRLSAHTFRHTYAVNFLRAGGSIHDLSLLLGHSSVSVTQRYLTDYKLTDARRGRSVLDSWGENS